MRFFRRRKFIVNREIQIALLRNSCLYILLFLGVIEAVFFVPLTVGLQETEGASETTVQVVIRFGIYPITFGPL